MRQNVSLNRIYNNMYLKNVHIDTGLIGVGQDPVGPGRSSAHGNFVGRVGLGTTSVHVVLQSFLRPKIEIKYIVTFARSG